MTRSVAVLVLSMSAGCFAHAYETPWPEPHERHVVTTPDGWELELVRITPAMLGFHGTVAPNPVIAQHGIVANGRNVDVDDTHSLARWLARRGHDVWIPSLRGTNGPGKLRPLDSRANFDFDTYASEDLPAVFAHVRRITGAARLDFVGHSMGGLLLYAHLVRSLDAGVDPGIGRAVTLAAPVRIRWTGYLEDGAKSLGFLAGLANLVPLGGLTGASLPLQAALDTPADHFIYSTDNVDPELWRRFVAVGTSDAIPGPLGAQMASWLSTGRFTSRDGAVDYLEGLRKVRTPVLVVAAAIDGIAPPWSVRPAFERLAGEKAWRVAGQGAGFRADYNHMDLVLGERAPTEVFPWIATWLAP